MLRSSSCFWILLSIFLLASDVVMAQTASTAQSAPSKSALRHQDRDECTKQAVEQNIAKRDRAGPISKCMAERQASRKASKK
ncbi:hypothetical protein [Bradyrhizobium sp. AZCC 2289]|jgi:hypothetical protein|uniref:hypothetical protein n=1 Tax=Bradyrhizobium sp. AZCC 2289 TaxID=3117026 RepID=UPI002FEF4BF0